jgi:hypothetical protein
MEKETPKENKTVESGDTTIAPDDQTGRTDDTTSAAGGQASLANIIASHENSHPGFDPAIHAVTEDGTPKRRADGSYALKRGRKSGQSNSLPPKTGATATAIKTDGETVTDSGPVKIAPDEMARQSANMVVNLAVWICGEEIGVPKDKAESDGLKMSFVNYYEARGVPNIPPELGLVIALGSYIGPRVTKSEKAKGFIERTYIWIRTKVGK